MMDRSQTVRSRWEGGREAAGELRPTESTRPDTPAGRIRSTASSLDKAGNAYIHPHEAFRDELGELRLSHDENVVNSRELHVDSARSPQGPE